jgi:hypothetical protein
MTSGRTKQVAALYLAIVFAAGAGFGFAAREFYSAKSAEAVNETNMTATQYRQRLVEDLDASLQLDEEQIDEVLMILDEVGERYHAVRDAMEPEFEAIRSERATRIMAVLTAEQRTQYESILEERRRRREERRREHREQRH